MEGEKFYGTFGAMPPNWPPSLSKGMAPFPFCSRQIRRRALAFEKIHLRLGGSGKRGLRVRWEARPWTVLNVLPRSGQIRRPPVEGVPPGCEGQFVVTLKIVATLIL